MQMPTLEELISEVQALRGEVRALTVSNTQLEQRVHDQGVELDARGRLTDDFIKRLEASETKFSDVQPYFQHLLFST